MDWREHLRSRLHALQPSRVVALDPAALAFASEVLQPAAVSLAEHAGAPGFELALGIDALDGLDAQQARQLISHTRLYHAPRILLAVRADGPLDEAAFIALGFTLCATDPAADVRIHYYDLDTYKTVPDWLNARYWAHPERWEP